MTLFYPAPKDKLFLFLGLTASAVLHASLFFSRPSITTTQDFAIQPSDFSVEITMIETSAGQTETVQEAVLTTPVPTSNTVDSASTASSPAPELPRPDPSPRLLPTSSPSQLPPSHASSTVLARPNPSRNSPPIYPEVARKNGWAGTVLLRAKISAQGNVESLTILKSTGHDLLDQSATAAVRQWHFHPQKVNGNPVAVTVELPVKFSLNQ